MKKAVAASIIAVLVCGVGFAGAAGKPKEVTRACFGVQGGSVPSRYDLNLYGTEGRVCLVAKPGKNGKAGAKGARGAAGANGTNGRDGANGSNGKDGANGSNGANGKDGPAGPAGPAGESVVGPAGPAGPAGANGADGAPGEDGHDGLGNALMWVCVNDNGDSMKYGGQGEAPDCQGEPGHTTAIHVVIVND